MASRSMKNKYTRIGWTATTERQNGKWRVIEQVSTYPANSPNGKNDLIGITADGTEGTAVVYLTLNGSVEIIKGLLLNILQRSGGPITLAADEEFQQIIKQVEGAINTENENSEAVVRAVRGK